jgi:opacity protein-like surface antigen
MSRTLAGFVAVTCLLGAPALAQDDPFAEETGFVGPLVWNVSGMYNFPLGDSADRVYDGWGLTAGVTFNPNPLWGTQFEYGASWHDLDTGALASQGIVGDAFLQYFDLNLVVRPGRAGRVGLYLIGGGGLYYRSVEVAEITGAAVAPYCDPWLFYCYGVPVAVGTVIGSRNSWDWGLDAGVGVTFGVAEPVRLYVEARYHYIFGPSFDTPSGEESADGQYLPLVVGVKF